MALNRQDRQPLGPRHLPTRQTAGFRAPRPRDEPPTERARRSGAQGYRGTSWACATCQSGGASCCVAANARAAASMSSRPRAAPPARACPFARRGSAVRGAMPPPRALARGEVRSRRGARPAQTSGVANARGGSGSGGGQLGLGARWPRLRAVGHRAFALVRARRAGHPWRARGALRPECEVSLRGSCVWPRGTKARMSSQTPWRGPARGHHPPCTQPTSRTLKADSWPLSCRRSPPRPPTPACPDRLDPRQSRRGGLGVSGQAMTETTTQDRRLGRIRRRVLLSGHRHRRLDARGDACSNARRLVGRGRAAPLSSQASQTTPTQRMFYGFSRVIGRMRRNFGRPPPVAAAPPHCARDCFPLFSARARKRALVVAARARDGWPCRARDRRLPERRDRRGGIPLKGA